VTQSLQLDEIKVIELHDAPRLLVEWSPRWEDFVTSIGPAFTRSGRRLAGEAPYGVLPYRGMLAAVLLEAFLLFVVIVIPRQIAQLRPYAPPKVEPYKVIYYSGNELPRVEDLGGAQSGRTGRAGGQEAYHRTQTIHIARGASLAPKIVDAPDLKLPQSADAVANLLAFKSNPAPPSAEGLHSSFKAPSLPANVIAPPSTNIARDQSRRGFSLNSVVPPAPSVHSEHTLYAPALDPSIIAPAPNVSPDRSRAAPALTTNVVAPASANISREQAPSTPALTSTVIAPAPAAVSREVSPSRVRMNDPFVVPPPVSAPERESSRTAKLTMPAPSVVAPPPSADSTRDLRRLESGSAGAPSPTVVPPPPAAANSGFVSNIIGKLFGTQDVVPPPPAVSSGSGTGTARSGSSTPGTLASTVIPPPPSAYGTSTGRASGTARGTALGTALGSSVIPPPPTVSGSDTSGISGTGTSRAASVGNSLGGSLGSSVIPPPPSIGGSDSAGVGGTRSGNPNGFGNGLGSEVVPPPPSIGSGPGLSGSGRKGAGLGGPGDVGSVLAPPKPEGGSGNGSGIVVSSQPGSKVGLPGTGGKGSLAMSPGGGDKPGLGGSGGGAGIGHGNGPGSGLAAEKTAENSGAGKSGTGVGSDLNAHGGISPTPGPGGAGTAPTGAPAVPGVDVRGGNTSNIVNLPSFGDIGSAPNLPGRSPVKAKDGPAITIVATSRSGGAFDFYGKLPGDNYTVYVDTTIGTVVMQFAEVNPAAHPQAGALTGPQGLRNDLPADLPHARVVIKCKLDAYGNLKNLQVLEPGPAAMTAKIMAALPSWKFRPAMRGVQPVEVNAILGFNIDTNDRY
jgi:hypothetical protein